MASKQTGDLLNLKTKLQQKTVVDAIHSIDWDKGSSAPFVVELDPTTACNLACPDCISRDLLNQGYFSRERMREITEELVDAGVKAVVLIGGGEPLAHPEIGWVIKHLAENNVQIGITTNGLLIDRYMDIIAEHVSWVRVSMDSATSETYNHYRPSPSGRSMFDRAIDNMERLAKIKQGNLGYSFLILTDGTFDPENSEAKQQSPQSNFSNVPEIYKGAVLAKTIGCDYYEIKPSYDIHHFSIEHRKELMSTARTLIDQSKSLEDSTFKVLEATKLRHVLNGEPNIEPKNYNRCAVSQLRTLVTPSGVYVCPYFRGNNDKKIGDLQKVSFKTMWHSEMRNKVMRDLDPSTDCKFHCIRHDSNIHLENAIAQNSDSDIEPINDFDLFI
jgi:sulfatase maturation enzyme AslB (radical SAM superfamily)